jgi:hypothetical protein
MAGAKRPAGVRSLLPPVEPTRPDNAATLSKQLQATTEENGKAMATNRPESPEAKGTLEGTRIKWDDASMKSSYANVCNVTSTREEVVLLFGMNQAWNRGQKEVTIHLTDRIVVSPYAAKRLSLLLQGVVAEYETRFGTLNIEMGTGAAGEGKK